MRQVKIFFFNLFIFGCVRSLLLHAGFLQLRQAGTILRCGARASHCSGFSCCGALALERRLSSCGARAQSLRGMWDLPGPGIEPMSPASAGRLLTTAPPGKSKLRSFDVIAFASSQFGNHAMHGNPRHLDPLEDRGQAPDLRVSLCVALNPAPSNFYIIFFTPRINLLPLPYDNPSHIGKQLS